MSRVTGDAPGIDPAIIGGMVARVGSMARRQRDASCEDESTRGGI
jgi:hypothetical protein